MAKVVQFRPYNEIKINREVTGKFPPRLFTWAPYIRMLWVKTWEAKN